MLAFLRILENPYDEVSWFRVLLLLDGVGPQSARRIVLGLGVRGDEAARAGSMSPLRVLLEQPPWTYPPAGKRQFDELRHTVASASGAADAGDPASRAAEGTETASPEAELSDKPRAGDPPLIAQIERIRRFYDPIFKNIYDNAAMRARGISSRSSRSPGVRSRAGDSSAT